jgi:hypothetical protein
VQATYRLFADEITDAFLNGIKDAYRNKEIEIIVREVEDETEYLLKSEANRQHLLRGIKEIWSGAPLRALTLERAADMSTKRPAM